MIGLVELEQTIALTVVLSGPIIHMVYLKKKGQLPREVFIDKCKKFIPLYILIFIFLVIAINKP